MIAATASRAAWQGPSGFSLASIRTASLPCGMRWRAAAASMGSVIPWKTAAADAAADRCRNERREKRGMGTLRKGGYQCWRGACSWALGLRGGGPSCPWFLTLLLPEGRDNQEQKRDQSQGQRAGVPAPHE